MSIAICRSPLASMVDKTDSFQVPGKEKKPKLSACAVSGGAAGCEGRGRALKHPCRINSMKFPCGGILGAQLSLSYPALTQLGGSYAPLDQGNPEDTGAQRCSRIGQFLLNNQMLCWGLLRPLMCRALDTHCLKGQRARGYGSLVLKEGSA